MIRAGEIRLFAAVLGISAMVTGCAITGPDVKGSGEIVSGRREVAPFTGIDLDGEADVTVTYGTAQSVEISTDDNILPIITTTVSDNVLKIDSKESFSTSYGVKVTITVPRLESLELDGSGDILVENAPLENTPVANFRVDVDGSGNVKVPSINATAVSMDIEGSGNIEFSSLNAANVSIELDGSGDITLSGTGNTLTAEIEGSGDIKADTFQTLNTTVKLEGSGDVHVYAAESLEATISGSGDVYYRGNPPVVKTGVTGSGDIIKLP